MGSTLEESESVCDGNKCWEDSAASWESELGAEPRIQSEAAAKRSLAESMSPSIRIRTVATAKNGCKCGD